MTYIDRTSRRIVTILYKTQTKDASGNYGAASETTRHANVIMDIQPWTGDAKEEMSGVESEATHVGYPEQHYSDVAVHDIVRDGSTDYEVLFNYNYRSTTELLLKKL